MMQGIIIRIIIDIITTKMVKKVYQFMGLSVYGFMGLWVERCLNGENIFF